MWGDQRFRRLSAIPPCAQGLWIYLLTGPHTGPIPGLSQVGRSAIAEGLGWSPEQFREPFEELFREGMVKADWEARVVWIPKAITCNRPDNPNVVLSWRTEWELIPECALKDEAFETLRAFICGLSPNFADAFKKGIGNGYTNSSANRSGNGTANGSRNSKQQQQQEQEQEQQKSKAKNPVASAAQVPTLERGVVEEIFAYWQKTMKSAGSKLSEERRKKIRDALKLGYTPRDLCRAIRGCSLTPWNMGMNEKGTKYIGIHVVFKNADQIDRFIEADANPPQPQLSAYEQRKREEKEQFDKLTGRDQRNSVSQVDPNVIDLEMTEIAHEPGHTSPMD